MKRLPLGSYRTIRDHQKKEMAESSLWMWDTEEEQIVKTNLRFLAQSTGELASHRNREEVGATSKAEFMFSIGSFSVELPEYVLSLSEIEMCREEALSLILWKPY